MRAAERSQTTGALALEAVCYAVTANSSNNLSHLGSGPMERSRKVVEPRPVASLPTSLMLA
jgi:hypothetical protein